MKKIIISCDSSCDLSKELIEKYDIRVIPMVVNFGLDTFHDGLDLHPDMIYERVAKEGILPKTSAISAGEYLSHFKKLKEEAENIIHFSISSGFSCTFQNSLYATEELSNVYSVDGMNLSTGTGLVILKACDLVEQGLEPEEIVKQIEDYRQKVDASFIIDKLDYLHKGGRCGGLTAFAATILHLKPCIEVVNGKMNVGKKYRGSLDKVVLKYAHNRLEDVQVDDTRVFITHSGCKEETINAVKKIVEDSGLFKEILITRAGCTVSTHCGPNTIGVLFARKTIKN